MVRVLAACLGFSIATIIALAIQLAQRVPAVELKQCEERADNAGMRGANAVTRCSSALIECRGQLRGDGTFPTSDGAF